MACASVFLTLLLDAFTVLAMRVSHLLVFGFGGSSDAEVNKSCIALYDRHVTVKQVPNVAFISSEPSYTEFSVEKVTGNLASTPCAEGGMYVVAHGTGRKRLGGIEPKKAAQVIAMAVEKSGLPQLDRLCLLVCGGGPHHTLESGKSILEQLCEELGTEYGLEPKIAGWDNYISVLYGEGHEATLEAPFGSPLKQRLQDPQHFGRKVTQVLAPTRKDLVDQPARAQHKHFFQWVREGGVTVVEPQNWSERHSQLYSG